MATSTAPSSIRLVVTSISCSNCRSGTANESTAEHCASCLELAGRARALARCLEGRQMIEAVSVVEGFAEACVWARLGCSDVGVILGCDSDPPTHRLAELVRSGMRVAWVVEEPPRTSAGFTRSGRDEIPQGVVKVQWRGDAAETARVIWELMVAGSGCTKPIPLGSSRCVGHESKGSGIAHDVLPRSSNTEGVGYRPNDVPLGLVFASFGKAAGATTLTAWTAVAASRRGYETVVVDLDRRSSDVSMVLRSVAYADGWRRARDGSDGSGGSKRGRASELVGDYWIAERLGRNLRLVSPMREDHAGADLPSELWSYLRADGSSGSRLYLIDAGEITPTNEGVAGDESGVGSLRHVSNLEMARTACPAVWRSLLVCRADRTGATYFLREACRLAGVLAVLPDPAVVVNCSIEDSHGSGRRLDTLIERTTGLPVVLRVPLELAVADHGLMRKSVAVPPVASRLLDSVFGSLESDGEAGRLNESSPHEGDDSNGSGRHLASSLRALVGFSFWRQLAGFRFRARWGRRWGDLGSKNPDASAVEAQSIWMTQGRIDAGVADDSDPRGDRSFEARWRVGR